MRLTRMAALLVVVSAGSCLTGCIGLFRPASPQAPSTQSGSNVAQNYNDVEATLATLADAIEAKGGGNGRTAYTRAFANGTTDGFSYTATFDPEEARRYQLSAGTLPTWNWGLEREFYDYFLDLNTSHYAMLWSPWPERGDESIDTAAGTATLHRSYQVYLVDDDGATLGRIAVGKADLFLKKTSENRWVIVQWDDRVDPAVGVDPTDPDDRTFGKRRLDSQ